MSAELQEILLQSKFYTTEWQLRMLSKASTWFIDTWPIAFLKQKSTQNYQLLVILCQDAGTQVIIPCMFGLYPSETSASNYEIFVRYFKVLQAKCPETLDPLHIVADYDQDIRLAIAEVFPRASVLGAFIHRTKLLMNKCKNIKCGMLGIKTAALTRLINYFISYVLVISMISPEYILTEWNSLKQKIDQEAFAEVIQYIEHEFLMPTGKYHQEMSYYPLLSSKAFRVSTPAIEGYQYRIKQLIKTYNVITAETLVEKVLISEERHFSSKVAEVNLGRIISPELPEKFFFERSMGPLPISTAMSDIYGMMDSIDPHSLAEMLVEQNEHKQLPQRRNQVSLCDLEGYKKSLISYDSFSSEIIQRNKERISKYKAEKAERNPETENMQIEAEQTYSE
jgi:hypothetical protein